MPGAVEEGAYVSLPSPCHIHHQNSCGIIITLWICVSELNKNIIIQDSSERGLQRMHKIAWDMMLQDHRGMDLNI